MYTLQTHKIPDAKSGINLYLDAGWGTAKDYIGAEKIFEQAYQNSHFILAKDGDKLIGMIRYFTDGFHDTQIIECLVLKQYQNQGIAHVMLNKLKEICAGTAIYVQSVEKYQDFFVHEEFKKHHLIGLSYLKKE
jgi:GNAT superfamily N-acetyltransferase